MRSAVAIVAGTVLGLLVSTASRAEIIYPWCAQYSTKGGARNCGFTTWEQCRATVSGIGGYCIENPFYQATITAPARRAFRQADVVPEPLIGSVRPRRPVGFIAAEAYRPTGWCGLKGRRGDPKLFLLQQARGCFD